MRGAFLIGTVLALGIGGMLARRLSQAVPVAVLHALPGAPGLPPPKSLRNVPKNVEKVLGQAVRLEQAQAEAAAAGE